MINLSLISLGCDKNSVDSEAILYLFNDKKLFNFTNNLNEADLIIINTCGFILDAKMEAIKTILDSLKYKAKVVVTGCLLTRYKEELKKDIKEVSLWIDFLNYNNLKKEVYKLFNLELKNNLSNNFDIFNRVLSTKNYEAYLKISEGCNNFCGFCSIPYIRGRFVSFSFFKLINEAKSFANKGIKELIIVSQDTLNYGKDIKNKDINFISLLKELEKIEGIEFITLLYLYPNEFSDELIELIKNSKKIRHYFDIPIQHASNKVLKNMLRKDTKESILNLLLKIKKEIPDAIFRTTLITGYPGETSKDFLELKKFINEFHFNHLGIFTYSKEIGTYAYKLKNQVKELTKIKRKDILMKEQSKISYEENKKLIGKTYKAIVISKYKDNEYYVRTSINSLNELDGKILIKTNLKHKEGDIINIKLTNAFIYDLIGEEVCVKNLIN